MKLPHWLHIALTVTVRKRLSNQTLNRNTLCTYTINDEQLQFQISVPQQVQTFRMKTRRLWHSFSFCATSVTPIFCYDYPRIKSNVLVFASAADVYIKYEQIYLSTHIYCLAERVFLWYACTQCSIVITTGNICFDILTCRFGILFH